MSESHDQAKPLYDQTTICRGVKPVRLRKKQWAIPTLEKSPLVVTDPLLYRGRWFSFFGREGPLHVEIGTGKGKFLNTLASLHPENLYLGIEMKPEALVYAVLKAEEIKPPVNIGFLLLNADRLEEVFEEGELTRIYLNFTDPWPKARHAKRRLTHPRYLEMYKKLLKPGGEIHLKTDHTAYFQYSLKTLSEAGFQLRHVTLDLHHSSYREENVMTEYEEKFWQQGVPVCRAEAFLP
ncbi:tRNA (guanine-N(7)-)-methyltransferase [[Clostridium] ultunense Esp]|nr:tRNA (guanine-N(7)-)-methyltransferase [[Clostridium] ultunense Esp]